jgi:hypothetical protein
MPMTVPWRPWAMGTRKKWGFGCKSVTFLEKVTRCAGAKDGQLDHQYRGSR